MTSTPDRRPSVTRAEPNGVATSWGAPASRSGSAYVPEPVMIPIRIGCGSYAGGRRGASAACVAGVVVAVAAVVVVAARGLLRGGSGRSGGGGGSGSGCRGRRGGGLR